MLVCRRDTAGLLYLRVRRKGGCKTLVYRDNPLLLPRSNYSPSSMCWERSFLGTVTLAIADARCLQNHQLFGRLYPPK